MAKSRLAWIYFLRNEGLIKIGRSNDPRRRVSDLGFGVDNFIGAYLAHPAEEQELHVRFAEWRAGGEWFRSNDELEAHIAARVTTPWDEIEAVENWRLSAQAAKNRKTYGISLNKRNPEDARLIAVLESASNTASLLRQSLAAFLDARNSEPALSQGEVSELRARMAWLQQENDRLTRLAGNTDPAAAADDPTGGEPAAAAGPALRPAFLAAVKAAARPGLKLGDPESDAAVKQETSNIINGINDGTLKPTG